MGPRTKQILFMFAGSFIALALAACGNTNPSFSLLPASQSFKQASSGIYNKIDILFVVDNSESMTPSQNLLTSNFSSFISDFVSKGYDFHIGVTTSDAYLSEPEMENISADQYLSTDEQQNLGPGMAQLRDGTDATSHTGIFDILPTTANLDQVFVTNATQGATGSADEREFQSMMDTLNSNLNQGFLEQGAFLAVVILSDEDDFSSTPSFNNGNFRCLYCDPNKHDYQNPYLDTVADYENYLSNLTGSTPTHLNYNVSAIAVLDSTCQQQRVAQSPDTIVGQRYIQIANDTNGILGSICDSNFATSLDQIQEHIAELSTQFFLTRTPDPTTITVSVNGTSIPQDDTNGWTYVSSSNSIMFHGTAIPSQGASISVNYMPLTAI